MYYNDQTIIFLDGEFVKPEAAVTGQYSQSLHYGNGVFEGIRAYKTQQGSRIFKAEEHFERLIKGAKLMDMNFDYSVDELVSITYDLLERNKLEDAYIRPLITNGADMSLRTSSECHLTIMCWPWGKYMGDKLLRVKTSSYERPNPRSCFIEAKITGHYVNSILSTNEAKRSGYDEALLLDMNGFVAECSGANIFMEKDGQLFTPPKGNIMPGITRSTIMDICNEESIPVLERYFTLAELKQADSAFFTGTAAEVVGLQSIDDYNFPKDWKKSFGSKLSELYTHEVLNTRTQKTA
jgi:branched-chain amino acid aminotransferase